MIDILTVLIVLLILVVPAVVLAGLGARIAAKRARLLEPETHGDDGGWPPNLPDLLKRRAGDMGPIDGD